MLNIALFGPPGAGKGTQSEFLAREYNLHYISTGDLLRREIAEGTKLGQEAASIIAAGGLVSDEVIVQIIEKTIKDHPEANGFLFDGFPRTYVQCYILEGLMIKLGTSLNTLISLEVDEEVAVERLLKRALSSGRSDDNEAVIRTRLQEYRQKTLPVMDFFREKGVYQGVVGTNPIEQVHEDIRAIVSREMRKHPVNIVLFGYPGSGRGTQGVALAQRYGLEYVATDAMLDEEIRCQTPLGRKVADYYETGILVPDEIVVPLIEQKLEHRRDARGFIFKDFPRTLVQSYILDGLLKKRGTRLTHILDIKVPTLELIRRLDQRRLTDRCKPYDTTTARIVGHLQAHEERTVPVIEKYEAQHGVISIDGIGTEQEVFARLEAALAPSFQRP